LRLKVGVPDFYFYFCYYSENHILKLKVQQQLRWFYCFYPLIFYLPIYFLPRFIILFFPHFAKTIIMHENLKDFRHAKKSFGFFVHFKNKNQLRMVLCLAIFNSCFGFRVFRCLFFCVFARSRF